MRTTEHKTKTLFATAGLFAVLCGSLSSKGTIAPSRAPRVLVLLIALAGVMACSSAPALAVKVYIPGVSFGSEGSGNGQFKEPIGVAVNDSSEPLVQPAAGDVYVVDRGNDRVERFSSAGAYLGQFNGSGTFEVEGKVETGAAAPTGAFSSPEEVAVDDSKELLDASAGDVYVLDNGHDVVDKFSATGEYLGQLTGGSAGFVDVAVDPAGHVWTLDAEGDVEECGSADVCEKKFETGLAVGARGMAVDSKQNVYINWGGITESVGVLKLSSTTGEEVGRLDVYPEGGTTFGLNPSTDNVIVDRGSSIAVFGPFGEPYKTPPLETFATEGLSESYGLGVNGVGTVYASERGANEIETFDDLPLPALVTEIPSNVSETAMTLKGTVDPEGELVSECYFEYGTEPGKYTSRVACEPSPGEGVGQIGKGSVPVPVSAQLSGLPPSGVRSVRLVAANANGVNHAAGVTISHPTTTGETFSNVTVIAAALSAQVDPGGLATKYRVEYGTSTSYGASTPEENIGDADQNVGVRVNLPGLQPGTQYHLRVVATNALGTVDGPDVAFATYVSVAGLPDGRVYEPVSPVGSSQDVNIYIPAANHELTGFNEHGINASSRLPFQAAADGEAVVYAGDPPPTGGTSAGGESLGNEYLARRSPGGGWTQVALETSSQHETAANGSGEHAEYRAFSSDLSVGILEGPSVPVTGAPLDYQGLYAHGTAGGVGGEYESLLTTVPDRTEQELYTAVSFGEQAPYAGANSGTGTVRADSHMLFESNADLLEGEGQLEQELRGDVQQEVQAGKHSEFVHYLYDYVGGKLYLVDVLPDGSVAPGGAFGSIQARVTINGEPGGGPGFTHVISADGSRVFWTYAPEASTAVPGETGPVFHRSRALYVRENDTQPQSPVGPEEECLVAADACTVQVDAAVGGGGIFQGASTDGSKVFFTKGELYEYDLEDGRTTDLSPGVMVKGVAGISDDGEYVYYVDANNDIVLWHDGVTTRVASEAATSGDYVLYGPASDDAEEVGSRTAEVTPDGNSLVFMSNMGVEQVFLYEAQSGRLTCVSCDPTGEAPVRTNASAGSSSSIGGVLPVSLQPTYQPRWITEDGGRVFFESAQPLVAQAANGWLDVYEWERDGTGSCQLSQGCIFLLSSGSDPENSYLLDASADGNDVFIVTRAQLVAQDRNDLDDVYDVRVGGVRPSVAPACSGTGCQGVPPAPPIFATPASVTFNGTGNFAPLPATHSGNTGRSAKCRKGLVKRNGRCVKQRKARRARRAARRTGRSSGRSRRRI
jgi:hypothetical protein